MLIEHPLLAVDVQDVEPGAAFRSFQHHQVVLLRELRVLGSGQAALVGRLAGEEKTIGPVSQRLDGETACRLGNDRQAGMYRSRSIAKLSQQLVRSGEFQRRRQRAEHRLNERDAIAHLGQGRSVGPPAR